MGFGNSIKREQIYLEFKLYVHKQTYKQIDRQTDLVLEVTQPEVGHLKHRHSKQILP